MTPSTNRSRHAVRFAGSRPVTPGMIVEGVLAVRREEVEKLTALRGTETCTDSDVLQSASIVVKAEQE